jgi:hypothetical protein
VEPVEPGSGEMKTGGLDRVLVGDDHNIAMGMLDVETPGHRADPLCNLPDLLIEEIEAGGMTQVSLQLSGEPRRDRVPGMSAPTLQ